MTPARPPSNDHLKETARRLKLHGLLARWDEHAGAPWLPPFLELEETERQRRSLERRLRYARIGRFKPIAEFDWHWPEQLDRPLLEDLLRLSFLEENANVIIVGPNGVGKTTLAQNLAYQAVLAGHSARFTTASQLLNDLAAQEGPAALTRRLGRLARVELLVIDEVGYLSYDSRYADLLFEVVSRRNQLRSTIVTTNREFAKWSDVFPNATSVVALVDRLVHKAEVVHIQGESYRLKEAKEREARRAKERSGKGQAKLPRPGRSPK